MFEENLFDEEIKKKKRRVLIVLLILLFLGVLAILPVANVSAPSPTTVAEATLTATRSPATPTPTFETTEPPEPSSTPTTTPQVATPTESVNPTVLVTGETPTGIGGGITGTPPVDETPGVISEGGETEMDGTLTITGDETPTEEVGEETPGVPSAGVIGGETPTTSTGGDDTIAVETGGEGPIATATITSTIPSSTPLPTISANPPDEFLPVTGADASSTSDWLAAGLVALLMAGGITALRNKATP